MAWEVTAAVAVVLLAWPFLPKYLKYGVNTISEFLELRYDTFTKRFVSILFIFTYVVSFLPVVLYSGSLVFNKMFKVDEYLGVSSSTAVIIISSIIGIIGIIYLFIGGLSLSAFSDSIYGMAFNHRWTCDYNIRSRSIRRWQLPTWLRQNRARHT